MAERHAPDIRIFVSCHKAFPVPEGGLLYPIHVGAALADRPLDGYIRDDSGENISRLNRRYCELTGQYWAWKNEDAEYYGFFHYRRYLYPDTHCRRPYIIRSEPDGALLEKLGYGTFAGLIGQYQLIAPIGEDMHVSVREHYGAAPFHRAKDLELAERIVARRYPEYAEAMEHYLSGTICYWGNIYIMNRETFFDYCGWLFPILREFDETADLSGYSAQELRVDGYLAERLFGVYYTKRRASLACLELPRVHFEPDTGRRVKQQVINALLPPGSGLRARVKKLVMERNK